MPVCLCGCGRETKLPTSKYCPGHNRHTEATKELLRTKAKQRWANPLFRLTVVGTGKLGVKKGYKRSPENCRAISDGRKVRMMQDLEFRQREIDKLLIDGKPHNTGVPATSAQLEGLKKGWGWNRGLTKETNESLGKLSSKLRGIRPSDKCIEAVRESNKNRIWTEDDRAATSKRFTGTHYNRGKKRTQSYITWIRDYMRKNNPMFVPEFKEKAIRNLFLSLRSKPNKSEELLDSLLKRILSNQFVYNGGLELGIIIGYKIPDFVNINGKKQVIELFGDYWHKDENPKDKIKYYKALGWDCLVIWEHELVDETSLSTKLREFSQERSPG